MPARIIIDGRETWDEVANGFIRYRGIFFSVSGPIVLAIASATGAPWWLSFLPSGSIQLSSLFVFSILFFLTLFSGIALVGLIYLRKRSRRSLNVKYYTHQVSHRARDWIVNFNKNPNANTLTSALNDLGPTVQRLFEELIPNKDIQIVTRIVELDKNGELVYKTASRTSGLSSARQSTSEAIPINSGLARYLSDRSSCRGVLICSDVQEATKLNILTDTVNHRRYSNEIQSLMAVGLNAWDGENDGMLGILFVTSRQKNAFTSTHIDCLGGVADILANLVSTAILLKVSK